MKLYCFFFQLWHFSLAIIYAVFAASNWAVPSVISLTGPKYAMVIGGAVYRYAN